LSVRTAEDRQPRGASGRALDSQLSRQTISTPLSAKLFSNWRDSVDGAPSFGDAGPPRNSVPPAFPTDLLLGLAQTSSMTPNGWHGTDDELRRLRAAVEHNCTCTSGADRSANQSCCSHALLTDQRVLDHLLYVCRMKARLEHAEWSSGTATALIDSLADYLKRIVK
jgi:hypothetical protein